MDVGANSLAAGIALAVTTGVVTFLFARVGKYNDARAEAEAAFVAMPVEIIKQQNSRIDQLSQDIDALWKRERECQSQLDHARDRIETLERRIGEAYGEA